MVARSIGPTRWPGGACRARCTCISARFVQHPARAFFRCCRPSCQIVPTVRLRGNSCLVGAIEPIEIYDRDQIGSRYHENQRTSQCSIFLMFVLHIFFRIVQAANNSLASAIGVPSPDSTVPDRKPETFSSRFVLTLIESRRARSRLAKNRTDAPSKA